VAAHKKEREEREALEAKQKAEEQQSKDEMVSIIEEVKPTQHTKLPPIKEEEEDKLGKLVQSEDEIKKQEEKTQEMDFNPLNTPRTQGAT